MGKINEGVEAKSDAGRGWREGERRFAWVGGLLPFCPCGVHFSVILSQPAPLSLLLSVQLREMIMSVCMCACM